MLIRIKDKCNSAPSFTVNPDYTHFVMNKMTGVIVSGWEWKEDAQVSCDEFNESVECGKMRLGNYKVLSARWIRTIGKNPFDSAYWGNK